MYIKNQLKKVDRPKEALEDLKYCVESFTYMQEVVRKVFTFARSYDESIELP